MSTDSPRSGTATSGSLAAVDLPELADDYCVGYAEADLDGAVRAVNREFCRLVGSRPDELLGRPASRMAPAGHDERITADLADLLAGRVALVRRSRGYLHSDGRVVPVVVLTRLIRAADGEPTGFRAWVFDDQEGARARAELSAANAELERRETFLSSLLATLPVGLLATDADGAPTFWNDRLVDLRSFDGDRWEPSPTPSDGASSLYDGRGTAPLPPAQTPLRRALAGEELRDQVMVLHPLGGARRLVEVDGRQVRSADGTVLGAVVVYVDLTEREQRRIELERSERRFRLGFENSPIGMALMDQRGRLLEVNDSLCRLLGQPSNALRGRLIEGYMLPQDVLDMRQDMRRRREDGATQWAAERHYRHSDGRVITAELAGVRVSVEGDEPLSLVQIEDITDQREAQRRLAESALLDGLTGLPNRLLLADRVAHALARAARTDQPVALLFCGLDGFKLLNEALGHVVGDEALRQSASRIRQAVRLDDTVGRLGGDEFVVLCEDSDEAAAGRLAERVEAAMRPPLDLGGEEVPLTVSIGIVVHPPKSGATTVDRLLHEAEAAMSRAKHAGRSRWTVYDAALRAEADWRAQTERLLRARLMAEEVPLHYQPVVDLATGRVAGVEALCRLRTDAGELVPAGALIAVAEDTGLIDELGEQVLRSALEQGARWSAQGHDDLLVAVNVSARQTTRPDYARHVLDLADTAGLPPDRLVLELTETLLMEATADTVRQLNELRDAGVGVAIDDFGTRYASLRYVQRLPISTLKIDMSFTAGLPEGRLERAIVTSVAQLAESLDLRCVAEGIETSGQLAALTALHVHGQGFLLGRPVPPEELDLRSRV